MTTVYALMIDPGMYAREGIQLESIHSTVEGAKAAGSRWYSEHLRETYPNGFTITYDNDLSGDMDFSDDTVWIRIIEMEVGE